MTTIRAKTTLAMTLVGLLPVLVLIGISASRTAQGLNTERDLRHRAVTRGISRHLTAELVNVKGDLASISSNPILTADGISDSALHAELLRLKRDVFTDLSLLDEQGFTLQSTLASDQIQEYSPWFRHTLKKRSPTVSSPFLAAGADGLQFAIYLPTASGGGGRVSVIRATISFDHIAKILDPVEIGQDGMLALLDHNGNVLHCSEPRELLEKFDASLPKSHWANSWGGEYSDPSGQPYNFVSQRVILPDQIGSRQAWSLVWFENGSVIDAAIREIYVSHGAVALFALALALAVGMIVSHRLTSPIEKLRVFSEQIARGELDARLCVGTTNELGNLADTMVAMGEEIKESRKQLEKSLLERAKHREDEILVREIHHRVKNNLQIIASLFRMNLRRVQGDEARQVIVESESRLRSMALLHEAMHRSGDVSEVDAGRYLRSVAEYLIQRHRQNTGENVQLEIVATALMVGIDTALPCGLIVNELIGHCLRQCVVSEDTDTPRVIELQLGCDAGGVTTLSVIHRGPAVHPSGDEQYSKSLSFKLVSLMADQLGGEVQSERDADGFAARVSFDATQEYTDRIGTLEAPQTVALPA